MPILRYFLFVGGALLALLVLADAVLPSAPMPTRLSSASDLPPVRIRSDRKWPERIVMDTTVATSAPARVAKLEPAASEPPAKSVVRDAFAQMTMADAKPQPAIAKAAEKPHASSAKLMEPA